MEKPLSQETCLGAKLTNPSRKRMRLDAGFPTNVSFEKANLIYVALTPPFLRERGLSFVVGSLTAWARYVLLSRTFIEVRRG